MNLSFSQILFILFIGFLLFGNLPLKLQDLSKFLQDFVSKLNSQKKEVGDAEKKKEPAKSEENKEKLFANRPFLIGKSFFFYQVQKVLKKKEYLGNKLVVFV